ncbi:MAG: sulfotransferase domain-containing protein [Pelagibacterales bacterium]|nr:sulfotransferase domain-containing protein [Pelagibacterales bacterium]
MIIWIASYTKSGNTWLRALLASYYFTNEGSFSLSLLDKIDAFPSDKFFKEYNDQFSKVEDTSKYWLKEQEKINKKNKITFLKTHSAICKINGNSFTNKENSIGAIYIVRDPRNVITSLSNHYQISIEDAFQFMKDEKRGIINKKDGRYLGFQAVWSWSINQKTWVENNLFPVLVIKYEDLLKETYNTFRKVIEFINKISNSSKIFNKSKGKNSIKNTSFEKLQRMENDHGFAEAINKKGTNKKIKFFNLGQKNNYKNLLSQDLIIKMNEFYKEELIKFNYEK